MAKISHAERIMRGIISVGSASAYFVMYHFFGEAVANAVLLFTLLFAYAMSD